MNEEHIAILKRIKDGNTSYNSLDNDTIKWLEAEGYIRIITRLKPTADPYQCIPGKVELTEKGYEYNKTYIEKLKNIIIDPKTLIDKL